MKEKHSTHFLDLKVQVLFTRKSLLCIPNANNVAKTKDLTATIIANAIISATINDDYWDSTIIHYSTIIFLWILSWSCDLLALLF